MRFKLLHRHSHKILNIENLSKTSDVASTVFLMKNINEGRNENWNNYAGFKGNKKFGDKHIEI